MTQVTFTVTRDEDEYELEIEGKVDHGEPAKLHGHPDRQHPGDPGYQEIESIRLDDKPWGGTLTSAEESDVQELLREQSLEDYEEAKGEAQIEAYIDSQYPDDDYY